MQSCHHNSIVDSLPLSLAHRHPRPTRRNNPRYPNTIMAARTRKSHLTTQIRAIRNLETLVLPQITREDISANRALSLTEKLPSVYSSPKMYLNLDLNSWRRERAPRAPVVTTLLHRRSSPPWLLLNRQRSLSLLIYVCMHPIWAILKWQMTTWTKPKTNKKSPTSRQ